MDAKEFIKYLNGIIENERIRSTSYFNMYLSLKAVVALHKAHEATLANGEWGFCCENCHHPYPCSTILAIEGALE